MNRDFQPELIDNLNHFISEHPDVQVIDEYGRQVEDYFRTIHADLPKGSPEFAQQLEAFAADLGDQSQAGSWFYYSWRRQVVHVIPAEWYHAVRSSRNAGLISSQEQAQLAKSRVGIAGLSVGKQVLKGLILAADFAEIRLADHDELDLSNLNRLDGSVADIGLPKVVMAAREVYELNPYAHVTVFSEGVTAANLPTFVDGLGVAVCAMDDLRLKIALRRQAAKSKVAIVMATDVENVFLDVEPHHTTVWDIFHGVLSEAELSQIENASPHDRAVFIAGAMKIIGLDDLTPELMMALPQIGRTIVSQPQLGPTAMISGAVAARTILRILVSKPVPHGRISLDIEKKLDPHYHDAEATAKRDAVRQQLTLALGQAGKSA